MRANRWRALQGALFLLLAIFPLQQACAANVTLTVAVDRTIERSSEQALLYGQVHEAIVSQRRWIDVRMQSGWVDAVIGDVERDKDILGTVEKRFADRPGYSLSETTARSFWIGFTSLALKKYGAEWLWKKYTALEDLVMSLRTPVPGVVIDSVSNGALVHARDPGFETVLRDQLGSLFVIQRRTRTSWHVAWNPEAASRSLTSRPVDKAVRFFVGEPMDLIVEPNWPGAMFTLTNPERYAGFVEAVREMFGHDGMFTLRETPSVFLRIAPSEPKAKPDSVVPDEAIMEIGGEVEEIANPTIEVTELGEGMWVHAKNPGHSADRMAAVRLALGTRQDLAFTTRPDQSIVIALVPGMHLVSPKPSVTAGQLAEAVRERAGALHLRSIRIKPAGAEQARVTFASDTDAAIFRRAVTNAGRLTVRLVDEPEGNDTAADVPSPEDEKLLTSGGESVWVKPGAILTGTMVAEAHPETDPVTQRIAIAITLSNEGRALFAAATRTHVGKRLAVVVNGVVVTAPIVQEPIEGGRLQISGTFTPESAETLAKSIIPEKNDPPLRIVEAAK